jgi:hypothetical protein
LLDFAGHMVRGEVHGVPGNEAVEAASSRRVE